MDIREALSKLDPLENDQWTGEGSPKIDAVKELLGRPVTRQEIIDAAPHFSRENPLVEETPEEQKLPTGTVALFMDEAMMDEFAMREPMDRNAFLGFLQTVPVGSLQELLDVLQEQQKDVAANRKKLDEFDLRIRSAVLHTKTRIQNEIPDISDREANQLYIKTQNELRARKHAATTALLKGVDMKSLDPRSAIDRAMARKVQRGGNRPNFFQKV